MNIHEAARKILNGDKLPYLDGEGICNVLSNCGAVYSYIEIAKFMFGYYGYLPNRGTWTDQRLNIICLLAITEQEDFE